LAQEPRPCEGAWARGMQRTLLLPLLASAVLLRARQPAAFGADSVNTTATELAAQAPLEYHPPPDVPKQLELFSDDQRFVSLAMSDWAKVSAQLAASFATIAAVPATRFKLVSEMQSAPALTKPRPRLALLERSGARVPVLFFFAVDITPGRPAECPCPCIPGTAAAKVADQLLAALSGPVDGFQFAARMGGVWSGNQTFPAPVAPPPSVRDAPMFKAATEMPLTPTQAWAFSNATKGVVDDFESGLHASMERAATALGGGGQIPCTRTVPGGVAGPCHFPGKIAGEIPMDQMGYPQKLPWTDPITYEDPKVPFGIGGD